MTKQPKPAFTSKWRYPHILLDSGAFATWTRGKQINLNDYITQVKNYVAVEAIDHYFNLDVMPGGRGRKATPQEIDDAAAGSFDNYLTMRKAGLSPIPVYHRGEDIKWLHKMLDAKCPYIGLGGIVWSPNKIRSLWLDRVWTVLTNNAGEPLVKVHGLGISSFSLLRRYPWYSADSTGWLIMAANGEIYVPRFINGKPDYTVDPDELIISSTGKDAGVHYWRIGKLMQERVRDFVENHVGVSLEVAMEDSVGRIKVNGYVVLKIQETLHNTRFMHRQMIADWIG